ncbi:MAG: HisA/HisF-related TIM barrel protein [Nitrososphaerales archaeon]
MIIVPAIDILGGKVVRVRQGKEETAKSYSNDPTAVARDFLDSGATIVHIVDLNAAIHSDAERNIETLKHMLSSFVGTKLNVEIAGGMRDEQRAKEFLRLGASRVVLGSIAYDDFAKAKSILDFARTGKIVLALDYDREGFVRSHGWKKREVEKIDQALGRFKSLGFSQFLTTSINQDGMLEGPDVSTLRKLRVEFPSVRLIASGGIASERDIDALSAIGIDEVIVGRAFYEGTIGKSILSRAGVI